MPSAAVILLLVVHVEPFVPVASAVSVAAVADLRVSPITSAWRSRNVVDAVSGKALS